MTRPPAIDPDALTIEAIRDGLLADVPVTVLGFARSGIAMARFLADAGARVTVYDGRPGAELGEAIAALEGRAVRLALGPDVDPASTWADARLVTTSPSINPAFPTTEPRLRAALAGARRGANGRRSRRSPALVSEPDLFLRLCVAPTVGVTGTKGKTTTASLTAAILAADPGHPVVLGGNIGVPILDRLAELTPGPPRRLRAVRAPAADAVARDDGRGLHERHVRPPRPARVARGVPAGQADPRRAGRPGRSARPQRRGPGRRRLRRHRSRPGPSCYRRGDPPTRRPRRGRRLDRRRRGRAARRCPRCRCRRRRTGRIMPVDELGIPGAHNVSNALAAVAVGLLFGVPAAAIREAAAAFTGVEHRLEHVATVDGVRFINDSQGTQPDAVIAALRGLPSARRPDRRRARQGRRPVARSARSSPNGRARPS